MFAPRGGSAVAAVMICIALLMPPLCAAAVNTPQQTDRPGPAAAGTSLAVTVRMDGKVAAKTAASDMQIYLCSPNVADEIRAVRKTGGIIAQHSGPYKAMLSDITFMKGRAERARIRNEATDAAGRCSFNQLDPGSYILFACWHDGDGAGYWMIPVTIADKKKTDITLSLKNCTEYVRNR